MGPADLSKALANLDLMPDANLLVGADTADDAAVYKLSEEIALINTVDFFTPMLDDPYSFGQVAAANALSDVYAMGGNPFLALNIVAFPRCLSMDILGAILQGGADKVKEAGARLAGGHSIDDESPKYGLAVSGSVHPDKFWTNAGAQAGDALVLTKPLGSGIICTAIKGGLASQEEIDGITEIMTTLNAAAAQAAREMVVHSCTDITGFGLLGHLGEMMSASKVRAELKVDSIPWAPGALKHAQGGMVPGGTRRNQEFSAGLIAANSIDPEQLDLLFDPQTSGGLLFSLPEDDAQNLAAADQGWVIGRVLPPSGEQKLITLV